MLSDLVVEGLGVIESADLSLGGGSHALTGETGAGKTLVVAAAQLLLGDRAERSLVRTGEREARVEGRFLIPAGHPALTLLHESGLVEGDDPTGGEDSVEVVVARSVSADGRNSKARINGRLVTLATLSEFGSLVMEIAGQHEHQRLGRAGYQRGLLDSFAGPEARSGAERVGSLVREAARIARSLEESRAGARSRSREADVLRYEIKEIDSAAPLPGEGDELHVTVERLEHAEEIAVNVASAIDALRAEGGAEESMGVAESAARKAGERDPSVMPLAQRLEAARYEIADVATELSSVLAAPDPEALEAARTRLSVLARLRRKYGATEAEVLEYLEDAREKLSKIDNSDEDEARLQAEHDRLVREAENEAKHVTALRTSAAPRLARAVEGWLHRLALPDASFEVVLEPRPLYEGGVEDAVFLVAPNVGEAAGPVAKAASGGELSRIALALSLVSTTGSIGTMIFDEVDAGVGGEAARAVGDALAQLARTSGAQVVVVTHLPQVAAFAERQYRVVKAAEGDRTVATVAPVEGEERVAELSRMLAGMPDSAVAQEHARELLRSASAAPTARSRAS
jgi:DNA repair protein RecN (Recombination protein N)